MQKTQKQKGLEHRWAGLADQYRRRHRRWVMETMPTMSVSEWDLYEQWIAGFGSSRKGKIGRQLRTARTGGWEFRVTAPVTPPLRSTRYTRMRFAMLLDAPAGGAAKKGRATRQK